MKEAWLGHVMKELCGFHPCWADRREGKWDGCCRILTLVQKGVQVLLLQTENIDGDGR
jgi:hypothetical protein